MFCKGNTVIQPHIHANLYELTIVTDGKAVISTQTMAKNDAAKEFTVKIQFINDDDVNNDAQDKEVKFDLLVNAVQKTTAN